MAKKTIKVYGPSEEAIDSPSRVQIPADLTQKPKRRAVAKDITADAPVPVVWVGVGGDCTIKRKPPKKSVIVLEATQAQYEWMYRSGRFVSLVIEEEQETTT